MSENWSEQYRLTAKEWVDQDAAANLLEECKSATFSEMMLPHHNSAVNKAEIMVKASPQWKDYLSKMVEARRKANILKVNLEFIRMCFSEQQSAEATARSERRL